MQATIAERPGVKTVEGTLDAINFQTNASPVYDHNGKRVEGYQRLWRADTGQTLSIMTEAYHLVQHRTLMNPAVEILGRDGWQVKASHIQRNGAAAYVELHRVDRSIKVVGEQVGERILMRNTYDGTTQLQIQVGAVVLACTNGAVVPGAGSASFSARHTGPVNERVRFMHARVRKIEEGLAQKMIESYSRLDSLVPSEIGREIIRRIMGERKVDDCFRLWRHGIGRDGKMSAWNLYNGITQYLTHDFKGSWGLRERKNEQALMTIAKFAKEGRLPPRAAEQN